MSSSESLEQHAKPSETMHAMSAALENLRSCALTDRHMPVIQSHSGNTDRMPVIESHVGNIDHMPDFTDIYKQCTDKK